MTTSSLFEGPLPAIVEFLENAFLQPRPVPPLQVFLDVRAALFAREVPDEDAELMLRALIQIARACFYAAQPREGLITLERAEQIMARLPDSDWKRQVFNIKGGLNSNLGDFSRAFDSYLQAAVMARQLELRDAQARTLGNIAALFSAFGGYWDALQLGERVLDMHAAQPVAPTIYLSVLNTMAEACLHSHQPERGIELGNRALINAPRDRTQHHAHLSVTHILLARQHLLHGRLSAAEREFAAAREHEMVAGYARAGLRLRVAEALIDHEKGRLRSAIQALKDILQQATGDTAIMKEALSALVTIHEKEGHPKSALKYLQRMSGMTAQVNFEQARRRLAEFGWLDARPADPANGLAPPSNHDFRLQAAQLRKRMLDSQVEVLERVAVAAEMRDDVTGLHCYRVGKWASLIALEMGQTSVDADAIEVAARLHDIGKIAIPDELLRKPAKLTPAEYEVIKRHAVMGARLLSRSKTPQIRLAEKVALCHHEHWDGSGYPQGLRGAGIPLAARITAVADVWDALTHVRSYKHAWPEDEALAEIQRLSGLWFDPAVVRAFESVLARLLAEGGTSDEAIESRLRRSRIMRIREYVLGEPALHGEEEAMQLDLEAR